MEKINIAEILKDCPKGMELNCLMYDNVVFEGVKQDKCYPIIVKIKEPPITLSLTKYGGWNLYNSAKCIIYPKGQTTWEGFVPPCEFKDGDIVATADGFWIGITAGGKSGKFMPTYCVITGCGEFEVYLNKKETWQFHRLATEEEKAKLFQTIKDNGYKWNAETKTLEKLVKPIFKIGNRIKSKINPYEYTIVDVAKDGYIVRYKTDKFEYHVPFYDEDNFDLIHNKFDITTLKPFESKVLVRDNAESIWFPFFFGGLSDNNDYPYRVIGGEIWKCCIPYEGNEHLLNKKDDCDIFYKNW